MNNILNLRPTWAKINLDSLKNNFSIIRKIAGPHCEIMGVVKANAYGHGAHIISKQLEYHGVDFLGVANIGEAISLRAAKITKPILVFGYTPVTFANSLYKYNITQAIFDKDYAHSLSSQAKKEGITISTHLKIDTGMNRLGFKIQPNSNIIKDLLYTYQLPNITVDGIFTHFAVADGSTSKDIEYTNMQFKNFTNICHELSLFGINLGIRHCCNSAATITYPEMHLDMVRPGILLYGPYIKNINKNLDFKPVMTLNSQVSMIKDLYKGQSIGYGLSFTAPKDMKIAIVAIGYADSYKRSLSNLGEIYINEIPAKVIGKICMDQIAVDITDLDNISSGSNVVIWGENGPDLNYLSKLINTIAYELLCGVNLRVTRVYFKKEKEYYLSDYITNSEYTITN